MRSLTRKESIQLCSAGFVIFGLLATYVDGLENHRILLAFLVIAGVCFAVGATYFALRDDQDSDQASSRMFSIRMVTSILGNSTPDHFSGIWVVHAGQIWPVYCSLFLHLTNSRPKPLLISRISIENRAADGQWRRMVVLNADYGDIYQGAELASLIHIGMKPGLVMASIRNKTVPPGDTVQGWMLLNIHKNDPAFAVSADWRASITDDQGVISTENFQSAFDPSLHLGGFGIVSKNPFDARSLLVGYPEY